jgi:membrane protease YdiL (CAAX protease family)
MQNYTSTDLAVLAMELIPAAAFGLTGDRVARAAARWPRPLRLSLPLLFALPYLWISCAHQMFMWRWFALYAAIPFAVSWLLEGAAAADPGQRGAWRDALVLLTLGLAVDLRWLEGLWPNGLAGLGKLLLVDAGLYGFVVMRHLRGTGFDFHFRWSDWKTGLRELAFFAPIVIALGLALRFLHPHAHPLRLSMLFTWVYIFIFVAVPEELFFRAWVQNLLENRFRARPDTSRTEPSDRRARLLALLVTSILFGLSHFNKRSTHFNWRYVILATIAGIFYGRAWRQDRRVPASSITHATVDTIWSLWF